MVIDFGCPCGSTVVIDAEDEEKTWLFVQRFSTAHQRCGFMTPAVQPDHVTRKTEQESPGNIEG